MICNTNQSPQQVLYNLYNSIALTELKGYMMMQFAYMLLKLYNKGNFTREAQIMRDRYEERTAVTINTLQKVLETASREFWKCDPKQHVKGLYILERKNKKNRITMKPFNFIFESLFGNFNFR